MELRGERVTQKVKHSSNSQAMRTKLIASISNSAFLFILKHPGIADLWKNRAERGTERNPAEVETPRQQDPPPIAPSPLHISLLLLPLPRI